MTLPWQTWVPLMSSLYDQGKEEAKEGPGKKKSFLSSDLILLLLSLRDNLRKSQKQPRSLLELTRLAKMRIRFAEERVKNVDLERLGLGVQLP